MQFKHIRSFLLLLALALPTLFSSGCALGPAHVSPSLDIPAAWREGIADPGGAQTEWWKSFNDSTLNMLVAQALENNNDIAVAVAGVDEARAYLGVARSAQLPSVSIQGGGARQGVSGTSGSEAAFQASGSLSFELDFWGKYRRATEAAQAELLATEAAHQTVRLSVIEEVCRAYFTLLSLDKQLAVSRDTLSSRRNAEKLYKARYAEGISGEYEYLQSGVETATALAQVQSLEVAQVQAENALSVLLGRSPREMMEQGIARPVPLDKLTVPDLVPAGIPSDLLGRRPDIVEAEKMLHSSTAKIGVAQAAFLPSFSLTGLFGYASPELGALVSTGTRQWSAEAGLLQPIFQGGRLIAELEAANARQRGAYSNYEKVVNNAFREVLDALTNNRVTRERLVTIQTQTDKLRRTLNLAQVRYDSGETNFLEVLDAQRALFSAEIELVSAQQAQLDAVVTLSTALGGGW